MKLSFFLFILIMPSLVFANLAEDSLPIAPQRYDSLADLPERRFGPPGIELRDSEVWMGKDDPKQTGQKRGLAGVSNGEKFLRAKVGPKSSRRGK